MNDVLLDKQLLGNKKWEEFALKLQRALADEYALDGVTVVLREMTREEVEREGNEYLAFIQKTQRFEFALSPTEKLPAAWKIADRIEQFLNVESDSEGA